MANFYWIDATGLLDWDNALAWSSTSGGSPDTTAPTTGANVFFDAGSVTSPTAGPTTPISIASLNTTNSGAPIPSVLNLTITGTLLLGDADSNYNGLFGAAATAEFIFGDNNSASTLLSGVFRNTAENNGLVTTAVLYDTAVNKGTITNGTLNNDSLNHATGTLVNGILNDHSYNYGNATTLISFGGENVGDVDYLTFPTSFGTNEGNVLVLLKVPGNQTGNTVTMAFPPESLGTFAALAFTGVLPPGGGPLGGPKIVV